MYVHYADLTYRHLKNAVKPRCSGLGQFKLQEQAQMYPKCHRVLGWCKSCTRCSRTGHYANRAILQTAIFHHTTHLDWMVPDYLNRNSNTYLSLSIYYLTVPLFACCLPNHVFPLALRSGDDAPHSFIHILSTSIYNPVVEL
jgi:hypothetical protein